MSTLSINTGKVEWFRAQLKQLPCKPIKYLAQEMGLSKGTMRIITKLLKVQFYKPTVIHSLQWHIPVVSVRYFHVYDLVGLDSGFIDHINLQLEIPLNYSVSANFHTHAQQITSTHANHFQAAVCALDVSW
jgi:hypothetical protein